MAITVLAASPYDQQTHVALDSKIDITFSAPIDPFTVLNGISIFHNIPHNWDGEAASIMDKPQSDISDVGQQYKFISYNYTINGNILSIIPEVALDQDMDHWIQIVPGNDPARFLSQATTGTPTFTRVGTSTGSINITSSYYGNSNTNYSFEFGLTNTFDLSINGVFSDSYTYVPNIPVKITNLEVSFSGSFDVGDTIELPVFASTGLTTVYKSKFTTSKYLEVSVKSSTIEDELYKLNINTLKIASSIPGCLSINNKICNPVIIKFTRPIDQLQNLSSCINIFKTNLETGSSKRVTFYYKFLGTDSVKIYLVGLDHLSSVSDLPIYNPSDQYRMQDFYKLPTFKYDGTLENTEIAGLGI